MITALRTVPLATGGNAALWEGGVDTGARGGRRQGWGPTLLKG